MKKRYKLLNRGGKIHILHWETDGRLFGPGWECIAAFDGSDSNLKRCREIIRLMNESDRNEDDRERDTDN